MLNKKIGILGGGQLGKMLIESYSNMNLKYEVLENDPTCPASLVTSNIHIGTLYNKEAITKLSEVSDVLTYEIEHVNVEALKEVSKDTPVIPHPEVLEIIQDKGLQKEYYQENTVQTLAFKLSSSQSLREDIANWDDDTFVLKHRKGGYDGKGVQIMDKAEFTEKHNAGDQSLNSEHGYVIEKFATEAREFSVIVCVDTEMNINTYEVSEMVFDPRANLMDYLISPCAISDDQSYSMKQLAIRAVEGFNSPGIFAVELIMTKDQQVYVNEIAPRPHNSGHHSIESCYTSQYEQLNRILLDLPLGSTQQLKPALTANILGPEGFSGLFKVGGLKEVLKLEGVYIHLYGKSQSKPFRKLGHFTVLADSTEDCINKMNEVRASLRIEKA